MSAGSSIDGAGNGVRPGGRVVPRQRTGPGSGPRELWVEVPSLEGPPCAWCYADRHSHRVGETAELFVSATVDRVRLRIFRDDGRQAVVFDSGSLAASFHPVRDDAFETGCDWPVFVRWPIPADLRPGPYLVEILAADEAAEQPLGHHLLIVRGHQPSSARAILLVASTSTWQAYNDWGGANHYYGVLPETVRGRSPLLSLRRPWARGQVYLPDGAPRAVNRHRPRRPEPARLEFIEWANLNGISRYAVIGGWASYEHHYFRWLEANGYVVDVATQTDLHEEGTTLLEGYACTTFVGHDEYWTREMREAVDAYVDAGGRAARFAGNFFWQIRLEPSAHRQIAYKSDAVARDPVVATPDRHRLTAHWDHPWTGYPGAKTFGVTATEGIYAAFGGMAPRSPRGFNVFVPEHWAFDGTGLGYADMFGDESGIFGFEMDGLDYTFVDGLPFPTYRDGANPGTTILAMGWATKSETGLPEHAFSHAFGDSDAVGIATLRGDVSPAGVKKANRGTGMIVHFERGRGEVFTAGTCEWVSGLIDRDFYTERITRNVLDRFTRPR